MHDYKILHITECYEAGVSAAIDSFTNSAPADIQHYLLYEGKEKPSHNSNFVKSFRFKKNILKRILQIQKIVQETKPDLIYTHSSWAGFYTRILPRSKPIIYQPHCYKFDDPTISPVRKFIFKMAEKVLTLNTSSTVVLTPHEDELTKHLNRKLDTHFIPNISSLEYLPSEKKLLIDNQIITVSMLGRIANQKDPSWFADVAEFKDALEETTGRQIRFQWIGSGEEDLTEMLKSNEVEVTGWLSSDEVLQALRQTSIYLHSASYEGFPLAVLDAASLGLPCIVRDLQCYKGTALTTVSSPEEAVTAISQILKDNEYRESIIDSSNALIDSMNPRAQRQMIIELCKKYNYFSKEAGV